MDNPIQDAPPTGDSPMGDLAVNGQLVIPAAELEVSFQTSGGPGGQHANRSATGVTIVFDFANSKVLTPSQRAKLADALGSRAANGTIKVVADKSRSQWRNRSLARSRLAELVRVALAPTKQRRATRPTRGSKARRVEEKRQRSATKKMRRRPEID